MEISSQEDHDIPIPINSAYGGGGHRHMHLIHHHLAHDAASAPLVHNNTNNPQMPSHGSNNNGHDGPGHNYDEHHHLHDHDDQGHDHRIHQLLGYNASINYKKQVRVKYKECLKNHAASMGGNATDGCGEFMPSGEEGSIEALTCSACNCHRNFHRKEVEGEVLLYHRHHHHHHHQPSPQRKLMLTHHPYNPHKIRSAVPHQMIIPPAYMGMDVGAGSHPYMPNSESEDQIDHEDGSGGIVLARPAHHQPFTHHQQQQKKRFRTKFTREQKEKMLNFAERVGWKIQREEESVVQQFCQEIGVTRRVLKVWMHNNKHHLAKKNNNDNTTNLSGNNNNNINNYNNAPTTATTGNLDSSA